MKFNLTHAILSLLLLLIVKSFVSTGLTLAEGMIGMSMVIYAGFIKYIEWKKSKEVEEDLMQRIKNIESKLSMTSLAKSINQVFKS